MKLIFDLDPLRVSLTGIGRYTYELAQGLKQHPDIDDLRYQFLIQWVHSPDGLVKKYATSASRSKHATQRDLAGMTFKLMKSVFRQFAPEIKGIRCLPYKNYIYHSPTFSLPKFVKRGVVTIHDMSMYRVPEFHPADRVSHLKRSLPGVVDRAAMILTDSDFSKSEILHYFDYDPDRVVSVPLGVDPIFRPASEMADTHAAMASTGLRTQSYTLFVSTIEPRKNIERLIYAYARLPEALRREVPLVLVGGAGWRSEGIHRKIKIGQEQGWLIYMSYVPEALLPHLYANARLFVFLSLYEGFGLPVLEAMASGVPVLCSNVASLPEVGGDSVSYVDPLNDEQIYEELKRLLTDDESRMKLVISGLARAKNFTWRQTVDRTVDAYKLVL